jgi:ribonuclease P protein component
VSECLSRTEKLTKSSDFLRVKALGTSVKENPFWLQVLKNQKSVSRLGVIATKRIGNAVSRNLAKRTVREIYRRNKGIIPVSTDVVILPKKSIFLTKFSKLEKCFIHALSKASNRL